MLYVAEVQSPEAQHVVYPYGPPVPGAIPIAKGCIDVLDDYADAVRSEKALLPSHGTLDGLGVTQDRAYYRFMRAMLAAQSLRVGPSRYEEVVKNSWDVSRAVDTGAVRMELTPDDFDLTFGGDNVDIVEVEASHIAACIRHIKDLQFEAQHKPYLESALGYHMLHAPEAWQVVQASMIALSYGYFQTPNSLPAAQRQADNRTAVLLHQKQVVAV